MNGVSAAGVVEQHSRRIIVMDEPTANIDAKTDELLQKMLRKMFEKRTLLCIAHRLQVQATSSSLFWCLGPP